MDKEGEIIVRDFTSILEELTFNSRPIITTLTKIAEENITYAQYFADALEARIDKCPPNQKLCAFYALDSICKNAGSPYTIYFSRNLFTLYKKTYLLVDNGTRTKLIHMFKTWMDPNDSTGGLSPLFERSALERIEQFLIKASALHQKNFQSMLPTPTVPLLTREIDKLTTLTNERLKSQPNDEKLKMKLVVLTQLKQELHREKLASGALKQLQLQLRQIFAQDQQYLQDIQRQNQQQQQRTQLQQQQQQQQQMSKPSATSSNGSSFIPLFGDNSNTGASLFGNSIGIVGPPNFQNLERSNQLSRMQNLYQSLDSEGLIYKPPKESIVTLYSKLAGDDNLTSNNADRQPEKNLPPIPVLTGILSDCKAYFATVNVDILNTPNLLLSQHIITSDNPVVNSNLIHLLYRAKPYKCNICGKRFGNNVQEKKAQADHLDWHFRINKRIKGSEITAGSNGNTTNATQKNIQSRNWYLQDSQWITFKDDEIVSTTFSTNQNAKMTTASLDDQTQYSSTTKTNEEKKNLGVFAIDEKVLLKKHVVVPESAEDMSFKCPICKEVVAGLYDEELGEWVWRNAMEVDNKYFHATCYYEAARNSTKAGVQLDLESLKHLVTE
ncbi:Pcf11p TDEL_0B01920 [Torulaspora delbrueckii]|uniref:CID domain-containing protein n=1 Tax=Torulaspora delbrueckii TaxID=4950 RepID=G8ZNX7_TORDE|nr:hypothetical protein TDEL_0B01920 [Torulaspora delbrueckii]CCE90321.1 hypothetical protein TDEL_0B01920 [Torulaspora delbrueckii]